MRLTIPVSIPLQSLLTAVSMLLLGGCAPSLTGTLKRSDGLVVASPEARVNISRLSPGEGPVVVVARVDPSGQFRTQETLEDGDYLVEALVPGYLVSSRKVRIGTDEKVELVLEPLPKMKTSVIGVNLDGQISRGEGEATLAPPRL